MQEFDRNERVMTLDSRHLNKSSERIINAILSELIHRREAANPPYVDAEKLTPKQLMKINTIKNMLFLKFTSVDYEGFLRGIHRDKRFKGVL